ncbi:TRAP transporter small permease [Lachnospiraceae bacterium NSJ-143]|nr:TRAP transporter small permease [Lachnospiraceae bacterium NSJ-143]
MEKIGDILEKAIKYLIVVLMGIMIVTTIIAVGQRYIVGSAFNWTEELDSYILVWCTFLGVAVSYRHADLVFLDIFVKMLPEKAKNIVAFIIHMVCLAFIVYIFFTSLQYGMSPAIFNRKSTTLRCSMFVPFAVIPLSTLLMILFNFELLPKLFKSCFASGRQGEV